MNDIFEMIGPIMIGPSSSHTAGAVRLGRVARILLDDEIKQAEFVLSGSFARTYRGHGTDKALIAGILNLQTDDERILHAPALARKKGISFSFREVDLPHVHPNTARISLVGRYGGTVVMQGSSIGGGSILISEINGMAVSLSGKNSTLLVTHYDRLGAIAAVTAAVVSFGINIKNFVLSRPKSGDTALMSIEADNPFPNALIQELRILPNIISAVSFCAI